MTKCNECRAEPIRGARQQAIPPMKELSVTVTCRVAAIVSVDTHSRIKKMFGISDRRYCSGALK